MESTASNKDDRLRLICDECVVGWRSGLSPQQALGQGPGGDGPTRLRSLVDVRSGRGDRDPLRTGPSLSPLAAISLGSPLAGELPPGFEESQARFDPRAFS